MATGRGPLNPSGSGPRPAGLLLGQLVLLGLASCGPAGAPSPTPPEAPGIRAGHAFQAVSESATEPIEMKLGELRRFELASGSERRVQSELPAGHYLEWVATQDGVDVLLELLSPTQDQLLTVDTPVGGSGEETLRAVVGHAGTYQLRIEALGDGRRGTVELRLLTARPATERDRMRAQAAAQSARVEALRSRLGDEPDLTLQAVESAERAVELWRLAGEPGEEARLLTELGALYWTADRKADAARRALEEARLLLDPRDHSYRARLHHYLGEVDFSEERPAEAMENFRRAVESWPQAEASSRGRSLNNLAFLERLMGRPDLALTHYREALDIWRAAGRRKHEARVLHNLGKVYLWLGDDDLSRSNLATALGIWRELDHEGAIATTLVALAQIDKRAGRYEDAERLLSSALEIHRRHGHRRGESHTLVDLGDLERRRERNEEAEALYRQALPLLADSGAAKAEGQVWLSLARLCLESGRLEEARRYLESASAIFDRLEDPLDSARALAARAELARIEGRLDYADETIELALETLETLRARPHDQIHRATFLATVMGIYETGVSIAVARHRKQPQAGHGLRAVDRIERSRARAFLDWLGTGSAPEVTSSLDSEDLESYSKRADEASLLYFLGDRESFLLVLEGDALSIWDLADHGALEKEVREVYGLLSERPHSTLKVRRRRAIEKLSRSLVPSGLFDQVKSGRWLIFPDGPVHHVPFAALRDPQGKALIERLEIGYSPSISSLAALRRREQDRLPPDRGLLVLADPVYDEDPRCPTPRSSGYRRLVGTATEAERLALSVPDVQILEGFEANLETLRSAEPHRFALLHFAVHGELGFGGGAGSRLVLAQRNEQCRVKRSFLDIQEILRWRLQADLVVLGACRSGLGEDIRGEGLVGIARAFLQAGSSQLVVSLWDVDDRAAVELMTELYRRLGDDDSPRAALRQAQLHLRAHPHWHEPFFWAAFVPQG